MTVRRSPPVAARPGVGCPVVTGVPAATGAVRSSVRAAMTGPCVATYLDDLLATAGDRVAAVHASGDAGGLAEHAAVAAARRRGHRLRQAIVGDAVAVIAEVKRASPSRGDLAPGIGAAEQARRYLDGGASAVSVLTEPSRFKGSLDDLSAVADLGAAALRKDFLVDPVMVHEAAVAGAAGVLLIVAALTDG